MTFYDSLWSAATFLVLLNFACLSWGVKGHFLAANGGATGMRLLTVLTLACFAWFLCIRITDCVSHQAVGPADDTVGMLLLSIEVALFWWAVNTTRSRRLTLAFSEDQPTFLHESGPYAWLRHPFYVS